MIIQSIPSGPLHTNCYIVGCKDSKHIAIIDPSPGSLEKLSVLISREGLIPQTIILTHSHWDHIADVAACKAKYNLPVAIHALDQPNLIQPGSDKLPFRIRFEGVTPDRLLSEGDVISLGKVDLTVIHTPGHTPGGICLYSFQHGVLISGDTLFRGSMGNVSFPTSDAEAMWGSLSSLAKLPAETMVYPGHGPRTTIGDESWLSHAKAIFG